VKDAALEIYNVKGQKVKTFPNLQTNKSSNHQIIWNGKDDSDKSVTSGIYFYKLQAGKYSQTKKMILMK
jgi:flagellar hook assembly protein FlgD